MISQVRPALVIFAVLSVFTGFAYPFVVTGLAEAIFPRQAAGSLIERGGRVVGSTLIGQSFIEPKYFWGRPSATGTGPYNATASGGSNQGPLNPALIDAVKSRVQALREADPHNSRPIPVDLVTASASGLDPHISIAAAEYQVARVARARGLPEETVRALVAKHSKGRVLGLFGEPTVNVLELNLALDDLRGLGSARSHEL